MKNNKCEYCNWFKGMEAPMPPSNESEFPQYFGEYQNPKLKYCPLCGSLLDINAELVAMAELFERQVMATTIYPHYKELIDLMKTVAEFRVTHYIPDDDTVVIMIPPHLMRKELYRDLLEGSNFNE